MKEIFDWGNPQKIFVVAVILILALIWAIWRGSVKNLKCLPPLEFFDENVVVTLLSRCDEGFKCNFSFKGVLYEAVLYIGNLMVPLFTIGDQLRARVINCIGEEIFLVPLEWSKDVPTDHAILTMLDEQGKWRCICHFAGFQRCSVVMNALPLNVRVGDHFKIAKFEGDGVILEVLGDAEEENIQTIADDLKK